MTKMHSIEFKSDPPGTLTITIRREAPTVDGEIATETSTEFFPDAVRLDDHSDGSILHPYRWLVTEGGGDIYLLFAYKEGVIQRLEIPERERDYFTELADGRRPHKR